MPERTLHFLAFVSLACAAAWASSRIKEPQTPVAWAPPTPATSPTVTGSLKEFPKPRPPLASPYVTGGSCLGGHLFGSVWLASDGCNHCSCGDIGVGDGNGRIFCTEMLCEKSDGGAPKTRHNPSPPGVRPVDDGF